MKIDVHQMLAKEALDLVIRQIDVCVKNRDPVLEVVHGFNHGVAIKARILKLSSVHHPAIIRVRSHILNPGISVIDLKVNMN